MTLHQRPSVVLRACEDADMTAIAGIYAHAVLHGSASFELEPPSVEEMLARRQKLVSGGYPYLVAELEGVVAGYAYAGAWRTRPAYGATVEDSVYVDSAFHGRGIGRALLGGLIDTCTACGFRQMIAVVGDSQNTASIKLHLAAGFDMTGTLRAVGWKHGRWLDTVLMQRALGPGDTLPRGA